jgi:hypothetical protein
MTKKLFLLLSVLLLNVGAFSQNHSIIKEFKNPDREYTIAPMWSWNGTLDPNEVKRQIDLMIDKGVYGAFMHARAGINYGETPYFSDGWWEAMDSTIAHSERMGFYSWLYDEDKWPSGSAGGRTVAKNPEEFIKKGLMYTISELGKGDSYRIDKGSYVKVFALRMRGEDSFSAKTDLTTLNKDNWTAPDDNWVIMSFKQVKDIHEAPLTHIDYFDKDAVRAFIDITHEEYLKRYKKQFGNTIPGVFYDEIYFQIRGKNYLPWTDDFAEVFKGKYDYDILDELPDLIYNTSKSVSVSFDFFQELTDRYNEAWFKQIADWCEENNIGLTGHTEETFHSYKNEGSYFQTVGSMQIPGTDNEDYRYNYPRYINWYKPKQLSSVAHIYGRRTTAVEAMGGGGYIVTPEDYKYGMASLGVYGINFFIPHFFHYSDDLLQSYTDWPPSWFFRNPYWKYFKPLADYGKRISFMNRTGDHVCHVALFYPITEQWANGFTGHVDDRDYNMVQALLLDNQIDYDIINPDAFMSSDCSAGAIKIHNENYKVLVLPSISTVTLETAKQIEKFYDNGGVVLALNTIPVKSIRGNNKELNAIMYKIFGIQPNSVGRYHDVEKNTFKPFTTSMNKNGGKGCFTKRILELPYILKQHITNEIEVVEGKGSTLLATQYKKDKARYYMLVNEERQTNYFQIQTPDYGIPYKLDIETGESAKVEDYVSKDGKLLFSFEFKPWEAFYLLFEEGKSEARDVMLASNTLCDAKLKFSNEKLIVTGWADPQTDNYYTVKYANGAESKSDIDIKDALSPVSMGTDWSFQVVDKRLDDKWTDEVKESVIDIPVMKFYANLDKKTWDFTSQDLDDSHFPEIKLMDRFSEIKGAKRYLSEWNASRIIGYEKILHIPKFEGRNVTFRKLFDLKELPEKSMLKITAEPSYTLFINGKEAGSNSKIEEVDIINIAAYLRKGENEIIVDVPRQIGLIAEGSIETGSDFIVLNTDDSWEANLDGIWRDAMVHSKPSLNSWKEINFSTKDIKFPVECWYRQLLPAGAVELILPKRTGSFTYYVNGELLQEKKGKLKLPKVIDYEKQILAIKAVVGNNNDGFQAPVKAVCKEVNIKLSSWKDLGLKWFSGRAIYKSEFDFPYDIDRNKHRFILDPGEVKWFSEIWVNGELVKYSPFGDHKADITKYIKKGKNNISIIVSNLRANETIWDMPDERLTITDEGENRYTHGRWWQQGATLREKEKLESGLLADVKIYPVKYIEVEVNK